MQRIKSQGLNGYLERAEAPVLVFLPGLGCSQTDSFASFGGVLSKYAKLTFDYPGMGENRSLAAPQSLDGLTELLHAAIYETAADNYVVVGYSFGAIIGLRLAEKYSAEVLNFIVLEGSFETALDDETRAAGQLTRDEYVAQIVHPKIEKFLRGSPAERAYAESLNSKIDQGAFYAYSKMLAQEYTAGKLIDRFRALPIKKSYIAADGNPRSLERMEKLKDAMPTFVLPGSSHFVFRDNPKKAAELIAAALD